MASLDDIVAALASMDPEKAKETLQAARDATAGMLWVPNPGPQTDAYYSPADVLYYGGSAGGGKSQVLLGCALNDHCVSRLFRTQFKDIDGEGGLAPAAAEVVGRALGQDFPSYAGYNSQKHVWRIPDTLTGGKKRAIEFGAFTNEKEAGGYQGRAADFFGFDEAVQFQEDLIRFIISWNRPGAGVPNDQRCRTIFASNPPVTAEGLWIFDMFGPWLDPEHPRPAKAGELRWYATVDGHEIEVDQDYAAVLVDAQGRELSVKPKSRTFIPASLSDNPDLLDSDYASQLASLPEHLQDAFARGKFSTTLDDAERQVIPTEWILKAQERWMHQKRNLIDKPMDALGVDVASGGQDEMVCAPLHGTTFGPLKSKPGAEVRSASEKFAFVMECAKNDPQFNIDNNGYGDDICSALESNNFNVNRIKGSFGPTRNAPDGREYPNYRTQMIWEFRCALHPDYGDSIALPPGRNLVMQLTSFREEPREESRKVIRIESDVDIKKRIGRSPDEARAVMFAWAKPSETAKLKRNTYLSKRKSIRTGSTPKVNRPHSKVAGIRR